MKVCIVGLGYIGFPTALLVAQAGHDVLGVDVNEALVEQLTRGEVHIVNEDGLNELAKRVFSSGRLRVSVTPGPADVFIIAVPTPFKKHGESFDTRSELLRPETSYLADLTYVESATRAIARYVQPGNLVVLESTVPPATTEKIVLPVLRDAGVDVSAVHFAHAPERVLPGNIMHELVHNKRMVGGLTPEASRLAYEFYKTFVQGEVVITDATTAELVKLMENTFRDVNIALANEFALVCRSLGVDVWEAIRLANLHPRVNFLRPGPGVGGHCIAVDPYFVVEAAPDLTQLIQAARRVNRRMPLHVIDLFNELTRGTHIRKIAILGASYKANVGDDRESPAIEIAHLLAETGAEIAIHDPYVRKYDQPVENVLTGADVILLLTDHRVYQEIDPTTAGAAMAQLLLLDTRGHLKAADWRAAGFKVVQLGAKSSAEVLTLA
jgi:UDP-N-acetyl-D-mannosaminuronic acid dehydrogenase